MIHCLIDHRSCIQDTGAGSLLKRMGASQKYSITTVPEIQDLADLAAQCVIQPGMSRVFLELLSQDSQQDGVEFYVREEERVAGLTFGQARKMYVEPTLFGLVNRTTGLLSWCRMCAQSCDPLHHSLPSSATYRHIAAQPRRLCHHQLG